MILYLEDSSVVMLDTMPRPEPEGTYGCGFGHLTTNPAYEEVLFDYSCDDGHSNVVEMMGTHALGTGKLTILDTLLNMPECTSPSYSPDGKKIAFRSDHKLYILYREVRK